MGSRILDLTVIDARDLKYVNHVTNMEVYVVVSLDGDRGRQQEYESPVDVRGGCNPTWRFNVNLHVDEPSAQQDRLTVHFNLRSRRTFDETDVGEVVVPVRELLDSAPVYGEASATKPVCRRSGKVKGELRFSYKFTDNLNAEFAAPAGHGNAPPLPPAYRRYPNQQGGMGLMAGLVGARLMEETVFDTYDAAVDAAGGF